MKSVAHNLFLLAKQIVIIQYSMIISNYAWGQFWLDVIAMCTIYLGDKTYWFYQTLLNT